MAGSRPNDNRTNDLYRDADEALLAGAPVFHELTPEARHALLALGIARFGDRHQIVACHEDGIFLVRSGAVRLYLLATSARELTLSYRHVGDLFYFDGAESRDTVSLVAEAVSDGTALYYLSRQVLLQQVAASSAAARSLLDALSRELSAQRDLLSHIAFQPMPARLARVLVDLALAGDGRTIGRSQGEVAALIGARENQVSRELAVLRDMGIVLSKPGERPLTVDVEALRASGLLSRTK